MLQFFSIYLLILLLNIFHLQWCYIQLESEISKHNKNAQIINYDKKHLLYFVPGSSFTNVNSWNVIRNNLKILDDTSLHNNNIEITCFIYVYDDTTPSTTHESEIYIRDRCRILTFYKGTYKDHIKALPPVLLEYAGFTHIFLCLDDVALDGNFFNITTMLNIMDYNNLQLASPSVQDANIGPTKNSFTKFNATLGPSPPVYGVEVDVIEIHAVVFNLIGWEAFWDLASPKYNSRGVGFERFVKSWGQRYVAVKQGLIPIEKINDYRIHIVGGRGLKGKSNFKIGLVNTMNAFHMRNATKTNVAGKSVKADQLHYANMVRDESLNINNLPLDYRTKKFIRVMKETPCGMDLSNHSMSNNNNNNSYFTNVDNDSSSSTSSSSGRRRLVPQNKNGIPKKHQAHPHQHQHQHAHSNHRKMSPECMGKLLWEFEHKTELPWRSWLDFEQTVRHHQLPEMLFRQRGPRLRLNYTVSQ